MIAESLKTWNLQLAIEHLNEKGYVVVENLLSKNQLATLQNEVNNLFIQERKNPFDPEDGPTHPNDSETEAFISENYSVSKNELNRIMRRIRHTRAINKNTPWPVPPSQVMKLFFHLPLLFDHDQSQRIMNLPAKSNSALDLIEEPHMLDLVRSFLGRDCVLSDIGATSIGPHTEEGGSWHVDVPLGQLDEPLPDFPLTVQNAWMLDDFTEENGATRVVEGSHKSRKKPVWSLQQKEKNEVILTGPAGSVAMWLSNTWHRSGPNNTDYPRNAVLCYYSRSWIKPFSDYRESIPEETVRNLSPHLRYLLGFSANGIVRG